MSPSARAALSRGWSAKLSEMETSDQLLRCIEEASKYAPVDQLALSPQLRIRERAGGQSSD